MIAFLVAVLLAVAASIYWLVNVTRDGHTGGRHKARGNADRWDR